MYFADVFAAITMKIDPISTIVAITGLVSLGISIRISSRDKKRLALELEELKKKDEKELQDKLDKKVDKTQYDKDMQWLVKRQSDQIEEWKSMLESHHRDNQLRFDAMSKSIENLNNALINHLNIAKK